MILPVSPSKVLALFAPLWIVLAISLFIHWQSWRSSPLLLAAVAGLPVVAAFAAALVRDRWRLELTPDALIHKTLGGTETFSWSRMGPLELRPAPFLLRLFARTFWFTYPIDTPRTLQEHSGKFLGRRLLCVFGDLPAAETINTIERWRALHARPARPT